MKNIANADRPKSVGAMLPPRPLRRSGKVAQTACNSDRREGKSCIPTLNQTFADSRILKISKFHTFRIAVAAGRYSSSSEVVREALRLMEKVERQEAEKLQFLRNAWQEGIDSGDARSEEH